VPKEKSIANLKEVHVTAKMIYGRHKLNKTLEELMCTVGIDDRADAGDEDSGYEDEEATSDMYKMICEMAAEQYSSSMAENGSSKRKYVEEDEIDSGYAFDEPRSPNNVLSKFKVVELRHSLDEGATNRDGVQDETLVKEVSQARKRASNSFKAVNQSHGVSWKMSPSTGFKRPYVLDAADRLDKAAKVGEGWRRIRDLDSELRISGCD